MSGYIGPSPVPQSIQRRETFTATASQTTFTTTGYTDGDYIDVYLNGIKLVGGIDYTATNGTDIVLTSGAGADDTLDFVSFNAFQLVDESIQFSNGTASAPSITNVDGTDTGLYFPKMLNGFSPTSTIGFSVDGSEKARISMDGFLIGKTSHDAILDIYPGFEFKTSSDLGSFTRDGGHPLLVHRLTDDGDVIVIQKDGSLVGAIGSEYGDLAVYSKDINHKGFRFSSYIGPTDNTGALEDDAVDFGTSSFRYKDIYLSGGAYLGGTTAANKLDDYEEGTWTPAIAYSTSTGSITYTSQSGRYTKIGQVVYVSGVVTTSASSGHTGELNITGLPYTVDANLSGTSNSGSMIFRYVLGGVRDGKPVGYFVEGGTKVVTITNKSDLTSPYDQSTFGNNMSFRFDGWYITT